ncbi:hypothetical protein NE237_019222 [Protea cynaroides]|uniref:RRM domain-containing protein n=1 Tax=Protea cynaroides TaxID=273540 RepID=A0A9Q0KBB1_9MAGN|nr:hypothetical protein NE237_019222 [Protea cynaroides]
MSAQPQLHQPSTWTASQLTLWIGDLQYWIDESYLHNCFAHTGEVLSIKIICNKITGQPEGYGFVEFVSHAAVEWNSAHIQWGHRCLGKVHDAGPEHSIFVGDLAPDVTDYLLQEAFLVQYPSVRGAKANAYQCSYTKEDDWVSAAISSSYRYLLVIPLGKGCGFVQFGTRASADEAIQRLHETMIGQQVVRLSRVRSLTTKLDQPGIWGQQMDPSQWSSGYYGYGQGYDAYAYGVTQDPSLYTYGAYAGYGQYPQQVDGVQEVAAITGAVPALEQGEEPYDPFAAPDVDKLNASYVAIHGRAMVARYPVFPRFIIKEMEPAKIDWKNVDSKFVVDEMYEHINAPTWIDFTAPEYYVDDEAWFCKSDCRHPKTVADFLKWTSPSKSKHLGAASVSEIFPLGDWNRRDANMKRRGLISSSNQPIPDPEKTTASKPPNKFNRENENNNPNFSTPQNHSKIMKAEIKSSTEKKKFFDESPCLADSTQSNRRPHLKSTLSARNLFGGRDILSQISELCNELKKLATRAKERENSEASNVEKGSPPELLSEIPPEWNEKVKEKKPLLQVEEGSSETKEQKQRRKKRNEETENIPIALDLKNVKCGDESLLMQVLTCPPSPQCFTSPRQALGPNKNTTTTTPLKPFRLKPTQGRGILQDLKQSNTKQMKEEPGEGNAGILQELKQSNTKQMKEELGEGNAGPNKSISTVAAAGAGTQVKSLDMFWFLKPCTFLNSVN